MLGLGPGSIREYAYCGVIATSMLGLGLGPCLLESMLTVVCPRHIHARARAMLTREYAYCGVSEAHLY